MAWIDVALELTTTGKIQKIKNAPSAYAPGEPERDRLMMLRLDFAQADTIKKRPRREFNDLAYIERLSVDQMAWSVYQPNDGDALEGDVINSWRSNAVRPIVRNKVFSIAAHVTARTLFPRIHAFDADSTEQEDAATIMSDLMEWSMFANNAQFGEISLQAVIAGLVEPVSTVFSQYVEVYRTVKTSRNTDGSWQTKELLDEDHSGFIDESVPSEQFYFADFFQSDVQKQPWVFRRRIRPYTILKARYGSVYPNFKYVTPGIQCIYNDANQQFYDAYDPELHQDEGEEILYWHKALDLFLIAVNGILLTDPDNPNPREDKLYPWASFGYEFLRPNGDSFWWKSLAFKTMPDDKIVNTLYPMIIDGSYLALFPPMVNVGGETISSDVIVPGGVTTLSDPNADLRALLTANENLTAGYNALFQVEKNITDDAFNQLIQGDPQNAGRETAYAKSIDEKNAKLLLGPFTAMVGRYVKQMGRLRIGDIKQYLTLPEMAAIEGSANADLIYKTFLMPAGRGRNKSKRIKFDSTLPDDEISSDKALSLSYDVLREEGGLAGKQSLHKVNPTLFRALKYMVVVTPDVISPISEELEQAFGLEEYDRMVQAPNIFDPEATGKLLLESYAKTRKHPENYLAKPGQGGQPQQMQPGQQPMQTPNPQQQGPAAPPQFTPKQTPMQPATMPGGISTPSRGVGLPMGKQNV